MKGQDIATLRYKVTLKKGYRIAYIILGIFMIAVSVPVAVLSLRESVTTAEYVLSLGLSLLFAVPGILVLLLLRKELAVYKGRIEYCNGFYCKGYSLSEVYEYDTRLEETKAEYGDGYATPGSWDVVSIFYDKSGKKLFRFGLAYDNVERLKKEVDNCRKSIRNNEKNKRERER